MDFELVGYVGTPAMRGGQIVSISGDDSGNAEVVVSCPHDRRFLVKFSGATAIDQHRANEMSLLALAEFKDLSDPGMSRHFSFLDLDEPNESDGVRKLDVIAQEVHVTELA